MSNLLKKIIIKLQVYFFNLRLNLYRFLEFPAQTAKERQIFKVIFDQKNSESILRIFEWGSGYSTLYYGQYLRKKGINFEWHSIDNNKIWHDKIKNIIKMKNLDTSIKLHLKEFIPFWEKPGWGKIPPACGVFSPKTEMELGYINFTEKFDDKFNIIIIDARFRRHCIQIAKKVLLSEGIVVMHDAQKSHYHIGLDDFKYKIFINSGKWYPFQELSNQVWVGSISNAKIIDALQSF